MLRTVRAAMVALSLAMAATGAAHAQTERETYVAPAIATLDARLLREHQAREARQGVAVDAAHFYAVVNSAIGKYDKRTGALVSRWSSPRGGLIRHINSCFAEANRLWCANSNFPQTPMASSIEVFDSRSMTHESSHSLGILDEGSLTFFDRLGEGWIAGFAHYDGDGGLAYKGAAFAGIVLYDSAWRRSGGYAIPASVIERMAPHAASGGAIGPDGLLYLFGHDRPELYVLARPVMGPVMLHVATINVDAAGQAFSWDRSSSARELYAINRPTGTVRVFSVPEVSLAGHPDARRFTP
jgi:hypothetical protein